MAASNQEAIPKPEGASSASASAASASASSSEPAQASQGSGDSAADLAQAYRDLARGEQAASALEANLSNLESKLDALLAGFEASGGFDEDEVKAATETAGKVKSDATKNGLDRQPPKNGGS